MSLPPDVSDVRPLALGYLRIHAADPPGFVATITAEMLAYAEVEGLSLAEVYTDWIEPPAPGAERAGFCALMDAVRRQDAHAVIIPSSAHLSRHSGNYQARRTIIETETGARLLTVHSR